MTYQEAQGMSGRLPHISQQSSQLQGQYWTGASVRNPATSVSAPTTTSSNTGFSTKSSSSPISTTCWFSTVQQSVPGWKLMRQEVSALMGAILLHGCSANVG